MIYFEKEGRRTDKLVPLLKSKCPLHNSAGFQPNWCYKVPHLTVIVVFLFHKDIGLLFTAKLDLCQSIPNARHLAIMIKLQAC